MVKCEVMAKLLPSLRAAVAKELRRRYGFSQDDIAKRLGVTQGAVSQYLKKRRGKEITTVEVKRAIREIADAIAKGSDFDSEVCKICRKIVL